MKKKFKTTDIEQYFQITNNIAPIYNEEKVHQIINSPKAVARLKGKNKNLLKFTIMTTIFVVIICSVMFWPKAQEEIPNSKDKLTTLRSVDLASSIPNAIEQAAGSMPIMKQIGNGVRTTNNSSDDEMIAMADLNKETSNVETSNALVTNYEQITASINSKSVEPAQQNVQKPIDFDPSTIQPTDGSRFILRLNKEELLEIGFQINDTSINFLKCVGGTQFIYAYDVIIDMGVAVRTSQAYLQVSESEAPCNSLNEIKPSCQTNTFYSELRIVDGFDYDEFNSANDTLLPIVVPRSSIDPNVMDDILWFSASDELIEILSKNHKPIIDEFKKYKAAKKAFPTKDLIVYQPPKLFDETKVVVLSKPDLTKLGFKFYADSTTYDGSTQKVSITYCKTSYGSCVTYTNDQSRLKEYNNLLAVMITRTDGSPFAKFNVAMETVGLNDKEYANQFPLFIPVLVKSKESVFEEDVIFWFNPTNELFNALPNYIGNDLRKEYSYITAEDKSGLVKPECKYYEECKNTLEITNFRAYPNPANQRVTVSFELPETIGGRISLVDLAGREKQVLHPQSQFAAGPHQLEFDLSSVAEGIYLLTLYSDKGVQTHRLMVVR